MRFLSVAVALVALGALAVLLVLARRRAR